MDKRVIPAIVAAMILLAVGLGVLIYLQFGPEQSSIAYDSDAGGGSAIDSGARIEIEMLRQQIEALQAKVIELEQRISALPSGPATDTLPPGSATGVDPSLMREGPNQIIDAYAQVVLIANRRNVNRGVNIADPSYLESVFGKPNEELSEDCGTMTNDRLSKNLVLEQVGPVQVRMLRPAIDSLRRVFDRIKATDPDLYARINTAGSLCVRRIRGSANSTSTHAFGLSLDLNIDGHLDTLGDGKTQLGLTILADFFRNEGWYWGAGFSREDSMHFEVGRDLIEEWISEGKL
ncbi:M15 family metallopeptidase [Ostreiculturibacter nitratireducens]|uniref:M15 family metallopeptidase n=1 Tax=Ostreiculturibacter nitratireducens TaxID=3075226 RepID=UPI0031B58794